MSTVEVRSLTPDDRAWVTDFIRKRWGADTIVGHGTIYYPAELPGFVATYAGERVGLLTYHILENECEIVTIDSTNPGIGVGTMLVETVAALARRAGCTRLWLVTTNDNLDALRFYQKRGFQLAGLHRNAVEEARKLKPEIPMLGAHGIPIRDEIELELLLT